MKPIQKYALTMFGIAKFLVVLVAKFVNTHESCTYTVYLCLPKLIINQKVKKVKFSW